MPGGWEDAALTNVYVLVSAEKGQGPAAPWGRGKRRGECRGNLMSRTDHCVKITHGLHGSHPSRQHRYVFKVVIVKMRSVPLHRIVRNLAVLILILIVWAASLTPALTQEPGEVPSETDLGLEQQPLQLDASQAVPEVVRDGLSAATAAGSCWDIKQNFPDFPSGAYWLLTSTMEAPQRFFCDQTMDGGGWVLIGQGREGWERFADGKGDVQRLLTRGRSPADFSPVQLPTATVEGLLSGIGVNELEEGMRAVRARDSAGTQWQTVDMRPTRMSSWTWALPSEDTVAGYRFDNGTWQQGGLFENSFGTDPYWNRVDLSLSATRSYNMGFGYGAALVAGSTTPGDFLWSRDGVAPLPYSELYLRPRVSSVEGFERIDDSGTAASEKRAVVSNFAAPTTWGVTGNLNGRTAEGNSAVQAFAEVGDTMFVGGNFTHAEQSSTGRTEPRTALAAFDLTTGNLREDFSLQFDNQVKSLLALPDGRLLVGGDFKNVNGERHVGTVVVDPLTGAIDPSWNLDIISRLSSGIVSVTSLSAGGEFIYIGGNFTHMSGNNVVDSYSRAAGRVSLNGTPDRSWNPEFNGTVVDIDTSAAADRFYAAGYFTRTASLPAMKATALSTEPGALPVSDWIFQGSASERSNYQQAIDDTGQLLFVGGSEHSLFGYDTGSLQRVSGSITKRLGGDVQAIASNGDIAYAGCHCSNNTYENAYFWPTLNSDWSRVDNIQWVGAWDARTGKQLGEFSPYLLRSNNAGAWSLFIASDGALWAGGDFRASNTSLSTSQWNGGWVRYPAQDVEPPVSPTPVSAVEAPEQSVELRWDSVADATSYEVLRDDRVIATAVGDAGQGGVVSTVVPQGGENRFFVRAVDAAGNRSPSTSVLTPAPGTGDPEPEPALVDQGAVWRYSYDQGTPASTWNTVEFDRGAWSEGAVPIGYGSTGLATVLTPPGVTVRPITTWFAHEFTVADPAGFSTATLEYVADDGAVVYLNGREVSRTRIDEGSVGPLTRANAAISTSAARSAPTRVEVPSSWLVEGANVLAAETHLNYRSSPSMSFDASLMITNFTPAPDPGDPDPEPAVSIPEGAVWQYRYEQEAPPAGWDTVADISTWAQGVAPIGWGHAGIATVLNVPTAERARTAYFVRDVEVDLSQAPADAQLVLVVRADDGALVRINGIEVGRKRLSEGPVDHNTYASASVNTTTAIADTLVITIPLSDLNQGTNRIAVETHLNYLAAPSVSFEFSAEVVMP